MNEMTTHQPLLTISTPLDTTSSGIFLTCILASGKSDCHCLNKRNIASLLLIKELKPSFNVNVSREKLMLY